MILVYVALGLAVIMGVALWIIIYIGGRSDDEMNKIFKAEEKKWNKIK